MISSVVGNNHLSARAAGLVARLRQAGLMLATAESCTGGLLSALITEIPGSSDVFERGFVTYSNNAKVEMLGVDADMIEQYGAVSAEVARAMAEGAVSHSRARISVSITGIAGPGGGSASKPVGLVHFGAARIEADRPNHRLNHIERRFGDIGRAQVRLGSLGVALDMIEELV